MKDEHCQRQKFVFTCPKVIHNFVCDQCILNLFWWWNDRVSKDWKSKKGFVSYIYVEYYLSCNFNWKKTPLISFVF